MISFAYPWFFILILLPLLVKWLSRPHSQQQPFLSVPFLDHLGAIAGQTPADGDRISQASFSQRAVVIVIWSLLVIAIARPQWIHDPLTKTVPGRDLLIAVDLSRSMETRDFTNALGEKTDRLTAVKEVMSDFLANREGDRVGLLFFGNAPFMQVPFTADLDVCIALLQEAQAGMAGPQTMLGDAVGKAITVFDESSVKEKVLIVLADGNDSGSVVPPLKSAEIARDKGIRIHTIGMGDPTSVGEDKIDSETLAGMAEITGGKMFLAIDREELHGVYQTIDEITTQQLETISYRPVSDLFFWPLFVAIMLIFGVQGFNLLRRWLMTRELAATANVVDRPLSVSSADEAAS